MKQVKKILIETYKIKEVMENKAMLGDGLPLWDGVNAKRYFNRKAPKQYIINRLTEILSNYKDDIIKIDVNNYCTKIELYVSESVEHYAICDKLTLDHNLNAYYTGLRLLEDKEVI